MYQPPPPYQPPPYQPPPPRRGFLQFGVGGAIVLISMSVLGTLARIHNHKHDADIESKKIVAHVARKMTEPSGERFAAERGVRLQHRFRSPTPS